MAILQRLKGKTALITGAGTGLGAATAERFGMEGANVVLNYFGSGQKASVDASIARIEAAGAKAIGVQGDVTDLGFLSSLFDQAVKFGGGLDILVNNAVRMILKPIASAAA